MSAEAFVVLIVPAAVGTMVGIALDFRRRRRITTEAAARWGERPAMGDGEFLRRCAIVDDPLQVLVALAARRAIAALGEVPPETIYPGDAFARDLVRLPFWDSLDWLGFVLEVERSFGGEVVLPATSPIDEAIRQAGGHFRDLRVEHVVRAMARSAIHHKPAKPPLDDDW